MRQGPNTRRSRGRGNGQRQNVPMRNQTFDSNGPDVRIRGNAYQVHEKYLALARDAGAAGDRIAAENYHQHAEHYFRIINQINDMNANANANGDGQRRNRPDANNGHANGTNGNGFNGRMTTEEEADRRDDEEAGQQMLGMTQPMNA